MARHRSNKLIKFKPNILVEFRGDEAWALDTTNQEVFQFPETAVKVIGAIAASPADGISLDRLQRELPGCRRAAILSVLSELCSSRLIEGFTPSSRRAAAKPASLLLGAFSLGAGVMLSPAPAHAMDCIGPPSCTAQGGTCIYGGPYSGDCFIDRYYGCNAGCS